MEQTVRPLFQISGTFIGDQPVVVIAATDALTLKGRRVTWRVKAFRALAAAKGFVPAAPSGLPHARLPNATVLCGVAAITLDLGAGSLEVEAMVSPTDEWREALRESDAVTVLFIRSRRRRHSNIASLVRKRRVFGGTAGLLSVDGTSIARYKFVGRQGDTPPIPQMQSVLLDASVLVDLERAAAGKGSPSLWPATQQLALQLVHMDVFPGPGLMELLFDRGVESMNWERAQSVGAAINAWFDGGLSRASSLEAVRDAYVAQLGHDALDRIPFRVEEHFYQQVFYASLLKLATLWSRARGNFKARQRVELFAEFVEWMAHDLKLASPLPLQIARDRLVGPQGAASSYTDQLMKLGKRPLDNLWGAAWDLVHLDAITIFESGAIAEIDGRDVVLVTADRGLMQLRKRIIDIPHTLETPLGLMPLKLARSDLHKGLQDHADRIADLNGRLNESVRARAEYGADRPTLESISGLIPQLELDVVEAFGPRIVADQGSNLPATPSSPTRRGSLTANTSPTNMSLLRSGAPQKRSASHTDGMA